MRSLVALFVVLSTGLSAAEVTVVLQFDADRSGSAVEAMQAEVRHIFRDADVQFDFRSAATVDSTVADLVVLRFKGQCRMDLFPAAYDERGPFAETYVTDGNVLPFGQVHCDRVRSSVRGAMRGSDLKHGDATYGRALGRVVAHEIYHMLAKRRGHSASGVNRSALTAAQLVAPTLELTHANIERFYEP